MTRRFSHRIIRIPILGRRCNIPPNPPTLPPSFPLIAVTVVPNTPANDWPEPFMLPMPLTGPDADRTSYPVLVDMFGWQSARTIDQRLAGSGSLLQQPPHNKIGMIPRRPLYAKDPTTRRRIQHDWAQFGIGTFRIPAADHEAVQSDGRHDVYRGRPPGRFERQSRGDSGGAIERQGRYSWAYLFQAASATRACANASGYFHHRL